MEIIARIEEKSILEERFNSPQSELIAIYGRRRIGKTYLVRNFFAGRQCTYFELIGQKMENGEAAPVSAQLAHFQYEYKKAFHESVEKPKNWAAAFMLLKEKVDSLKGGKHKVVLFFDELPWLCSPNSRFYENFDQAWNASFEPAGNVKAVICGSASTWMLKKIIYARAGLSRRVTGRIHLKPFTLSETYDYLRYKKFDLSFESTAEVYMMLGGVPYYLNFLSPRLSIYQNIEALCFQKGGYLTDEFDVVFDSLFRESQYYKRLMELLSGKRSGMTIEEISAHFFARKRDSSHAPYQMLNNLEECDFIRKRAPLFNEKKGALYFVADEFTLFHLKWIRPAQKFISNGGTHYAGILGTQGYKVWMGFAFEMLCLKHEALIRKKLGLDRIPAVSGVFYAYSPATGKRSAQIDLVFDRADKTVTICEIKHHQSALILTTDDIADIRTKKEELNGYLAAKRLVRRNYLVVYITMHGVKRNAVFNQLQPEVITLDDFR